MVTTTRTTATTTTMAKTANNINVGCSGYSGYSCYNYCYCCRCCSRCRYSRLCCNANNNSDVDVDIDVGDDIGVGVGYGVGGIVILLRIISIAILFNLLQLPLATMAQTVEAKHVNGNNATTTTIILTATTYDNNAKHNKASEWQNVSPQYTATFNRNNNNSHVSTTTMPTTTIMSKAAAATTTTTAIRPRIMPTWLFNINNGTHQAVYNATTTELLMPLITTATAATTVAATTTSAGATLHDMELEMNYHPYCMAQRNSFVDLFTVVLYAIVCLVGLFGNTLVIYVVLRFSKMQTVTNIYILNLAIADECFLIGIPFLLYTMRICSWKFGEYMCKAYMVSTSITQFTSSIFLLIMSADRYIAVCHPIASPRYRTLHIAKLVSAVAWLTSAVLMLPVILYASTVQQEDGVHLSCNIEWPEAYKLHTGVTFILYTFFLGFATPLCFILSFYYLVIRKLHAVGAKHKSKEKKRSHRKVTRLVLTVITVYILCWLPHWISQVALINSNPAHSDLSRLEIAIFLLLGCLVYSNSAVNPILYAFLSDNFRKSFFKAFTCMAQHEINAQLQLEPSVFTKQGSRRRGSRRLMGPSTPASKGDKLTGTLENRGNSSTTTSSTTTAEKSGTGTTLLATTGSSLNNSTARQANGRVSAVAEDIILVLDQEQTVCALIERVSQGEIVLQTDL